MPATTLRQVGCDGDKRDFKSMTVFFQIKIWYHSPPAALLDVQPSELGWVVPLSERTDMLIKLGVACACIIQKIDF
eukprot:SAG25_NODE_2592_length_1510_cov_1.105599_4_plen_76_part_00